MTYKKVFKRPKRNRFEVYANVRLMANALN